MSETKGPNGLFFTLGVLLLGRFRWYRRLMGGTWARSTKKAEIGQGIWIPGYQPIDSVKFERMIEDGFFERESYV
jgi:hypothetical protein